MRLKGVMLLKGQCVCNALKGCKAFHSYDGADIDITNVSVQSSLKHSITVIGEN